MATAVRQLDNTFIGKVYGTTALTLLFAAISSTLCSQAPLGAVILSALAGFALIFGIAFTRGALSAALCMLMGALEGPVLGPVLHRVAHVNPGAIGLAAGATAVVFLSLTAYVFQSRKDFSAWGGALFVALIVLLIASVAAIFLPILKVLVAAAGVIIFSLYILYDTSQIINGRYEEDQYGWAAVGLYLDILNLFLDILQLILFFED